jgi:DNA-binding CsgD family transcriptional regulator
VSWEALDPEARAIFERVCSPRELEVVNLRFTLRHGKRLDWRRIARWLDLDESTVRAAWRRAERKFLAAYSKTGSQRKSVEATKSRDPSTA